MPKKGRGGADVPRDLWREDGKLTQTVSNARGEMEQAERGLAGMMDRVCT
jgi:hypothetical protein